MTDRSPMAPMPMDQSTPIPTYQGRPLARPYEEVVDQGLRFDIETLIDRRRALKLFGYAGLSAGVVALAACAPAATGSPAATPARHVGAAACHGRRRDVRRHPRGDRRPVPRRRLERRRTCSTESGVVRSDIRVQLRRAPRAPPRACR